MRLFFTLAIVFLLTTSEKCNKKELDQVYKARVEVVGICSNITLSVIEGKIDANYVEPSWTDETTKKTYTNAFKLGNPCSINNLKAGEEFYFKIDTSKQADCAVCMAYYPTPSKALSIKRVGQP